MRESIPTRALRRLSELRVADVMSKEVVTISQNDSMSMVARIFRRQEISSAPVVDEAGRCTGILSASDFVKREYAVEHAATRACRSNSANPSAAVTISGGKDDSSVDPGSSDRALDYMTPAVQSVDSNRSLLAAARVMCGSHIHRLLVLDSDGHPVGMLTTMDFIAALLNAIDEAEAAN